MPRTIAAPTATSVLVGITTNYTANPNETILADTSGGPITVTIPASTTAIVGTRIAIIDPNGRWGQFNCTVGTTTSITRIAGLNETLVMNIPYRSIELLYTGAQYGWVLTRS